MLEEFKGDLHVHTCLSPCGDFSMLPALIIMKAKERDLDIIGICDHNSTENVMAVKKVGTMEGVTVIGGIEITSQEEVHILALFDDDADLLRIQNIVYEHLPGVNDEDAFGEQLIVDEKDEILGFNEKLLIGATTLFLEQVVDIIHQLGGIAIAAHVDRDAFSIIGQLGFIPEGLDVDGLEISPRNSVEDIRARFPQVNDYPLVSFS
ncbi:PHP domain-containing protein, partial [candidate division WOR-3 bacterium]|nr:PHP domain-containing protein [candidate division WOR-3 bacterium]